MVRIIVRMSAFLEQASAFNITTLEKGFRYVKNVRDEIFAKNFSGTFGFPKNTRNDTIGDSKKVISILIRV